jgi:hypothetical protein
LIIFIAISNPNYYYNFSLVDECLYFLLAWADEQLFCFQNKTAHLKNKTLQTSKQPSEKLELEKKLILRPRNFKETQTEIVVVEARGANSFGKEWKQGELKE